ncbi:MAG: hypothetical protein E6Q66_07495 [Pedobacter sp.]|nr:MAG: hypothetical protein E6Q66_07495 [Pedobacter sp.]
MIKTRKSAQLSPTQTLTIDELTALYQQFNDKMKEAKANVDRYKALLVAYAHENEDQFKGNLLTLSNGIKIERRSQLKADFAKEKVTLKWLEQLIDDGFGELVEVKFADKEVAASKSSTLNQLMGCINYSAEIKEILAVKAA